MKKKPVETKSFLLMLMAPEIVLVGAIIVAGVAYYFG